MAGAWRVLVLVVGLAAVACEAQPRRLSYEEIVTMALKFFNRGQQGQSLFRLLEATPPPSSNSTKTPIPLNFRIKETVCILNQQRQPRECAFKEGGEERKCTGSFLKRPPRRILTVDCVPVRDPEVGEPEVPTMRPSADPFERDSLGLDIIKQQGGYTLHKKGK
ncbi:PREDICTED: 15 kDa protein B-like [Condylura cristata]|uniref:15 kDa protein B-like n=1 Tax=Condylura cristata TaxID=143302 RepID=UPI0003346DA5|nr:PREDICTED: 15 kDa protein B-like [Condylura cristata]